MALNQMRLHGIVREFYKINNKQGRGGGIGNWFISPIGPISLMGPINNR
jgi:hypothetical protein